MIMISKTNDEITLSGWVKSVRDLNKIIFVIVRDNIKYYQITITAENEPSFSTAKKLRPEYVIETHGKIKPNSNVVNGFEIIPDSLKIISEAQQPVPLNLNENVESSLDKKLDYRFLSLREPKIHAIFNIQSTVTNSIEQFFIKRGFTAIHTSKIVSQATEGGANVFPILYFDKTAYLAQSPQFYKQMMMAAGYQKVFEIGPVFRAEPHHTTRHLCEYTSIDIEVSFIKSYEDIMSIMEELMVNILKDVKKSNKEELDLFGIKYTLPKVPFPRITFNEARKILYA